MCIFIVDHCLCVIKTYVINNNILYTTWICRICHGLMLNKKKVQYEVEMSDSNARILHAYAVHFYNFINSFVRGISGKKRHCLRNIRPSTS